MKIVSICLLLIGFGTAAVAQNTDLVAQANKIIGSFDDKQKAKAIYTYDNAERTNWNFVPVPRQGINFHDLNDSQREAVLALLRSSISEQGYKKATAIVANEDVLRVIENRPVGDDYRDPQKYFVTFFGKPEKGKLWGWRFEGHHLSLNFSSLNGLVDASTPSFFGANPGIVPDGPKKGTAILKDETDMGFAFVNGLTPDQLKVALFSEVALPEIVSSNKRQAELLEPKGLPFTSFNDAQKKDFLKLLDLYVLNYQFGFSSKLMDKIKKAGIENLSFAWAGSLQPGKGHYYRIQGPMLLIEYDNTQTNANHVHTTVRDLTNDFAGDILKEHYEKEHK